jgi:uncharacterized protein (DUF983 family)
MIPPAADQLSRTLIGRALRLRCPLCGNAKMFRGWVKMRDYCGHCGFRFDRNEPDYFIGAYTINLIVSELIVVAAMIIVILVTWPNVPWDRLTWTLVACMIPAPLITYPFSKSLWLAIDLTFQPPIPSEYRPAQADPSN